MTVKINDVRVPEIKDIFQLVTRATDNWWLTVLERLRLANPLYITSLNLATLVEWDYIEVGEVEFNNETLKIIWNWKTSKIYFIWNNIPRLIFPNLCEIKSWFDEFIWKEIYLWVEYLAVMKDWEKLLIDNSFNIINANSFY